MSEQEAGYVCNPGERVTTNWAAEKCGHSVCSETAVYYLASGEQIELCPACAGIRLSAFYAMRLAILALAERMERPMPCMGNGDVAKELREIAKGGA